MPSPTSRYTELNNLRKDPNLRARVTFSLLVYAEAIKDRFVADPSTTTQDERTWARFVMNKPETEMPKALNLLLSNYKGEDDSVILNADDETVQGVVDAIVPYLIQCAADA